MRKCLSVLLSSFFVSASMPLFLGADARGDKTLHPFHVRTKEHKKKHYPHPAPVLAPPPTVVPRPTATVKKKTTVAGESKKVSPSAAPENLANKKSPAPRSAAESEWRTKKETSASVQKHASTKAAGKVLSLKMGAASIAGATSHSGAHQSPTTPAQVKELARKVALGKQIFFDKNLSNPPGKVSCATCHVPEKGFSNDHIMEGAVAGRYGNRRPPTIVVLKYNPAGPPTYDEDLTAYVGGFFWDGRSATLQEQPGGELSFSDTVEHGYPFFNPNEMNNLDSDGSPDPDLVISKIENGSYANLFRQVYGETIFYQPAAEVFPLITDALARYETSDEVAAFSSKYDAIRAGKAAPTPQELLGFRLFTGKALCSQCHNPEPNQSFSQFCYANIGVPKNPDNPYYTNTNRTKNPFGYNKAGYSFVDVGLGDFPATLPTGGPSTNGSQKVVTVRNVGLHKGYMANGYFTDLRKVVHFYNTRNRTHNSKVLDFTLADPSLRDPLAPVYAAVGGEFQAIWPRPEVADPATLINAQGLPASQGGQVGNLGLTNEEEDAIVAFLLILSDGFCKP